jgi:hypothetical protein
MRRREEKQEAWLRVMNRDFPIRGSNPCHWPDKQFGHSEWIVNMDASTKSTVCERVLDFSYFSRANGEPLLRSRPMLLKSAGGADQYNEDSKSRESFFRLHF